MNNNLDQDSYIAETIFVVAIFATELGERNANKICTLKGVTCTVWETFQNWLKFVVAEVLH